MRANACIGLDGRAPDAGRLVRRIRGGGAAALAFVFALSGCLSGAPTSTEPVTLLVAGEWDSAAPQLTASFAVRNAGSEAFTLHEGSWWAAIVPWPAGQAAPSRFNLTASTFEGRHVEPWSSARSHTQFATPVSIPAGATCLIQPATGIWGGSRPADEPLPEQVLVAVEWPTGSGQPLRGAAAVALHDSAGDSGAYPACSENGR